MSTFLLISIFSVTTGILNGILWVMIGNRRNWSFGKVQLIACSFGGAAGLFVAWALLP